MKTNIELKHSHKSAIYYKKKDNSNITKLAKIIYSKKDTSNITPKCLHYLTPESIERNQLWFRQNLKNTKSFSEHS